MLKMKINFLIFNFVNCFYNNNTNNMCNNMEWQNFDIILLLQFENVNICKKYERINLFI